VRKILYVLALLALALPVSAQQQPDSVPPTPEQRALERLRALGRVAAPDTMSVDSIGADSVAIDGRAPAGPPPSPVARDSIMQRLLGIRGYIGTEYAAGEARYLADSSRLMLYIQPQVSREGNQLVADSSITYDERRAEACGYGNPVLHASDMTNPLQSDTVCYNVERRIGYARGARTTVEEGAQWNVRGDVYVVGDNYYSHNALFTDCNEPYPHYHYHFAAGQLKIVRGNIMVARDVTLNFADVPVFWLPFMVQSMSRGRRSGILMPRFGINDIARTSSRYSRRIEDVGVYWAINEYLGAELALDWFANNWTGARGSFDYNFTDKFLRGGVTYRQFWKQEGGRDFTIASQNDWQPDERTRLNLTANYTTSTDFVSQRTFDPRELNRTIESIGSLRRTFDWGSASLGASRRQQLSDNTVTTLLPSLDLSISPITLFEALPGEERFFSNSSWSGGFNTRVEHRGIDEVKAEANAQAGRSASASGNSRFNVGNLSFSQNFSYNEQQRDERLVPNDTGSTTLEGSDERRGNWSADLSYQQRLFGTTTLNPSIRFGSEFARNERSENRLVTAPARMELGASLNTNVFGFWPGVGPFERFRHKISPSISYNYSPETQADSLQAVVFSGAGVQERNRIQIGFSQTFEAKYRSRAEDDEAEAGTRGEQEAADSAQEGPRRRQQAAIVNLLSISTDAVAYDFVQARERGDGIATTEISNSIQSDLLRGLQLRITHDLFENTGENTGPDAPIERRFKPHLSSATASFSLSGNSWLFRILRLGSGDSIPSDNSSVPLQGGDQLGVGPAVDRTESEYGMIGTSRRTAPGAPRGSAGAWNASFDYTLRRPRETAGTSSLGSSREEQMLKGRFSFQPTENWTMNWQTGYSFSTSEFTDHTLTLTRMLHDWDANFDFVKAQNGNFSFQFRVNLRANPDIKLDYQQNDIQGLRRNTPPPGF